MGEGKQKDKSGEFHKRKDIDYLIELIFFKSITLFEQKVIVLKINKSR